MSLVKVPMSNMPFATYAKELMFSGDLLYKLATEPQQPQPTCPSYFNGGVCAVGPSCKMDHSVHEIKIPPSLRAELEAISKEPFPPSPPKVRRKKLCPSYFDGGVCMVGPDCEMDHSIYEIKISTEMRAKLNAISSTPSYTPHPPSPLSPLRELKPIREGQKAQPVLKPIKEEDDIISCEELERLLLEAALR